MSVWRVRTYRCLPFVLIALTLTLVLVAMSPVTTAQRKLKFGVNWNPDDDASAGFLPVVRAFEELHPDVEIEMVWVTALTQAGWASTERTITMWAAGMAPDVVMVATDVLGQHAFAGLLTPLNEFVAKSGIDPADFVPGSWNEMHWDGVMYAMPLKVDPNFALVWNKEYASQAGLEADLGPRMHIPAQSSTHSGRSRPPNPVPRRPVSERSDAGTCSLTEVVD